MVEQFLTMLTWGVECSTLVLISPLGIGLLAIAGMSGIHAAIHRKWPAHTWFFLLWPAFMAGTCILWGMVHEHHSHAPADETGSLGLNVILILYLVGSLAGIYAHKQARLATTCILSTSSIVVLGCAFVAGMAVTGDWL